MQHILENFRPDLFNKKQVLVSGGTSGIGLEIALGFNALGATVIATGSSQTKLDPLKAQYPAIKFARLDVSDPDAINAFVVKLSSLDVLVNAAGISRPGDEYDDATFHEVMSVNLSSVMRLSSAAEPLLIKSRGSIINIASMLSYLADPLVPGYCASKSGLLGLTRALAHQLGDKGIRVNAIAPGYHRTAMTRELWDNPQPAQKIEQRTALKRWGDADDLVGAALFLASTAAGYVTGTTLAVDGGYVSG